MGDIFADVPTPVVSPRGEFSVERGAAIATSRDCQICKPKIDQVWISFAPILVFGSFTLPDGSPNHGLIGAVRKNKAFRFLHLPTAEEGPSVPVEAAADLSKPFSLPLAMFDVESYLEGGDERENRWAFRSEGEHNRRIASLDATGRERLLLQLVKFLDLHNEPTGQLQLDVLGDD